MILDICSSDNKVIKHIKQLLKRKYRQKYLQYIVEGIRIVKDALDHNKKVEYIVFCEELQNTSGGEELLRELNKMEFKIYQVPNKIFKEISDTQNPQGIIAVLSYEQYDIDEILNKDKELFLILDRVQDPGNLGTIIRTADAAGFDAIFLSKGCVDLYNLKTIRSTMGSIFHLPIIHVGDTGEVIHRLKSENIKIVSTSLDTNKYYYDIDYKQRMAFVIGNEANGVLQEVIHHSDEIVKIPMIGKAESLNASIAASIIMYEAVKQRNN